MSTDPELKYEDHPDFNQSIDNEVGEISILGESFAPSYVLFELAQETYRIATTEYYENAYEELKQVIFDYFPACIAFNYRLSEKGEGATDPVRKLLHLKDTWEAIIFVIYALVMGELRYKGTSFKSIQVLTGYDQKSGAPQYSNLNSGRLMSEKLKEKLQNLRAIIQFSKTNGYGFKLEEIDETILDDLEQLQNIRNDISHTAAPTREQAESELRQVIPSFQQMLTKTRFLENCRILRFDSFSSDCRCEIFNGHSLNREYGTFTFDASRLGYIISLTQEQIFVQWDNDCFSLSPFLHFERDTTGHESYVCFYKRKKDSKYWYEPVKMRDEKSFDHLQSRFEAEKVALAGLMV